MRISSRIYYLIGIPFKTLSDLSATDRVSKVAMLKIKGYELGLAYVNDPSLEIINTKGVGYSRLNMKKFAMIDFPPPQHCMCRRL